MKSLGQTEPKELVTLGLWAVPLVDRDQVTVAELVSATASSSPWINLFVLYKFGAGLANYALSDSGKDEGEKQRENCNTVFLSYLKCPARGL